MVTEQSGCLSGGIILYILYNSTYWQVTQSHARNDHLIADFCDASLYKNHTLYTNGDSSLKLQFITYYDEVEVSNPLGSHKGKHKLGKEFREYIMYLFNSTHS